MRGESSQGDMLDSDARRDGILQLYQFMRATEEDQDSVNSVELLVSMEDIPVALGSLAIKSSQIIDGYSHIFVNKKSIIPLTWINSARKIGVDSSELQLGSADRTPDSWQPNSRIIVPGAQTMAELEKGMSLPSIKWRRRDIVAEEIDRADGTLHKYAPFVHPRRVPESSQGYDPSINDPDYHYQKNSQAVGYLAVLRRVIGSLVTIVDPEDELS